MANRSDTFNRANNFSAVGTPSDGGSDWVELVNNCGIFSNQIFGAASASTNLSYLECSEADGTLEVTMNEATGACGFAFRITDANNYWIFRALPSSDSFQLGDVQSGSFTERDLAAQDPAATDVLSVVLSGNSISCKVDGVEVCSFSSSFNNTATKHGWVSFSGTGSLCDNWSFTGSGGGGGLAPDLLNGNLLSSPLLGGLV